MRWWLELSQSTLKLPVLTETCCVASPFGPKSPRMRKALSSNFCCDVF